MDTAVTIVAAGGVGRLEAVALVKNLGLQKRMAISWMWLYDTTPGRVHTDTGPLLWPNTCSNLRGPVMGFHSRAGARVQPPTPQSAVQWNAAQHVARPLSTVPTECRSARRKTTVHCIRHTISFQKKFEIIPRNARWTAVAQWLRCCATNRKVAGSIPAGVIGIFH